MDLLLTLTKFHSKSISEIEIQPGLTHILFHLRRVYSALELQDLKLISTADANFQRTIKEQQARNERNRARMKAETEEKIDKLLSQAESSMVITFCNFILHCNVLIQSTVAVFMMVK